MIQFKKGIDMLLSWKREILKEEENHYTDEYKKSKYYKTPTLKDVLNGVMINDYNEFAHIMDSLNENDLIKLKQKFYENAKEYGSSWYDEDLKCYRTGWEFECNVYVTWLNIIQTITDSSLYQLSDFYENIGV